MQQFANSPSVAHVVFAVLFMVMTTACRAEEPTQSFDTAVVREPAEATTAATPKTQDKGWQRRGVNSAEPVSAITREEEFDKPAVDSQDDESGPEKLDDAATEPSVQMPAPQPLEFSPQENAVSLEGPVATGLVFHPNEQSTTWSLGDGDRIGFFSLESGPTYEFNDPESFTMTSGYGIHFLSGPSQTDLPPRLFDFFVGARWTQELALNFGFDANFNAGIYTDFEDSSREGWRFPGRALLYFDPSSTTRLLAGIEYLDRDNIQLLPAGGLIITPEPDVRLELYFPRPRLRYRLHRRKEYDRWLYVGGEYKGSSWAIERVTGNKDVVTYNEYRIAVGWETRRKKNEDDEDSDDSSFFEVGYIFGRELEFRSRIGNFSPDDTFMIRWGSRF